MMTTAGFDFTALTNLGAVGLIAALGIAFVRFAYKRECDKVDALTIEAARLNALLLEQQNRFLPLLTSSQAALEESASVLKVMQMDLLIRHAGD